MESSLLQHATRSETNYAHEFVSVGVPEQRVAMESFVFTPSFSKSQQPLSFAHLLRVAQLVTVHFFAASSSQPQPCNIAAMATKSMAKMTRATTFMVRKWGGTRRNECAIMLCPASADRLEPNRIDAAGLLQAEVRSEVKEEATVHKTSLRGPQRGNMNLLLIL